MPKLTDAFGAKLGSSPLHRIYRGEALIRDSITNLAINPSFESSTSTTEVRRNLVTTPIGYGSSPVNTWGVTPRWYGPTGYAGSYSTVIEVVTLPDGTVAPSYHRKTWTAIGTINCDDISYSLTNGRAPLTAGATYTAQFSWRKSWSGSTPRNQIEVKFYNAVSGGSQIGATLINTLALPTANTWQQNWITFTIPVGATHVSVDHIFYTGNATTVAIGSTIDFTAACVEISPVREKPFWGSYSPDVDLAPLWTGASNYSSSVLRGKAFPSSTVSESGNAIPIQSKKWGGSSLRLIPTTASNDSYTHVGGAYNYLTPHGVKFVPGKTYTAMVTARLEAPLTGTLASMPGLRMWYGVNGNFTYVTQHVTLNAAGVYPLRIVFTVPAHATSAFVRCTNGSSRGNGDVWWDDLMIVEGNYTGPYRDGDSPGWTWTGIPHQSTSFGLK